MATKNGHIDFVRRDLGHKPVKERLTNYDEHITLPDQAELKRQAARCMGCEVPFCHALGCPLSNRIPEFNELVFRGEIQEAYRQLSLSNNFPEITGRICPALCECACSLAISDSAVSIRQLELGITEEAFNKGYVTPRTPKELKNKSVGIIGSGPSGLAAADELAALGYRVTVYEKADAAGGMLRYGIPDFKLPKQVLDRRLALLKAAGIAFKTGRPVTDAAQFEKVKQDHDALLLCMGTGTAREIRVEGRESKGILTALEYLGMSNEYVSQKRNFEEMTNAQGKEVLIIGGGDTGADCIGTANRQDAKRVTQIEIMPKPPVWDESCNPNWPNWPSIYRVSSSHEEGCGRLFSVKTLSFEHSEGSVKGANCINLEYSKDGQGRLQGSEIEGSEFFIPAQLVVLCMGFLHVEHFAFLNQSGIELDTRGNILVGENFMTTAEGVFAAGDTVSGASITVKAISSGLQAAKNIDAYFTAGSVS